MAIKSCLTCGEDIEVTRHPLAGTSKVWYEYTHVPGGRREEPYPVYSYIDPLNIFHLRK